MRNYVAWRLAWGGVVVASIVAVTFVLTHIIPGDPIQALVGDYPAPDAYVESTRRLYGLDRPLLEQLYLYVVQLAQGNLGYSFAGQQPVAPLIATKAGLTLLLMVPALVISTLIGVAMAATAARNAGGKYDAAIAGLSLVGYSIPIFWLAQLTILLFAVTLRVLPAQGMTSAVVPETAPEAVLDVARHAVLPVFVLVVAYLPTVARVGRSSIYASLQQDFVLTARSKGFTRRRVMWTHVLPSALGPIITVVGYQFSHALTGALLTETVFGWPGLGNLFVVSISKRDYPVLSGIFLLAALAVVVANLLTDLAHAMADPRVRDGLRHA